MKLQLLQDLNNHCPYPMIYFNTNPMISKKPDDKQDWLKVKIKNQPYEINTEMVFIYNIIFNNGSYKDLLNLLVLLKSTPKGQNLITCPQMYSTALNLLSGEGLL